MGNMDMDAPGKRIDYENIEPKAAIKSGGELVMYEYPLLNEVDGEELARKLMTAEMVNWIKTKGYESIDPQSEEGQEFLNSIRNKIRTKLKPLGLSARFDIGTCVMMERIDNNPLRKLNVVMGIIRSKGRGETKTSLLVHAVDVGADKELHGSSQRREDGTFDPPVLILEEEYPFGYRGMFSSVCSYPVKKI